MRVAPKVTLTDEQWVTLRRWARGRTTPMRLVRRAQIVLSAAADTKTLEIAEPLGLEWPSGGRGARCRGNAARTTGGGGAGGGRRVAQRGRFEQPRDLPVRLRAPACAQRSRAALDRAAIHANLPDPVQFQRHARVSYSFAQVHRAHRTRGRRISCGAFPRDGACSLQVVHVL